jgi:hypothetical protein
MSSLAADFVEQGILQLVPWYDKCLNSGGDYNEKEVKHVDIYFI